jgi:hypothetical protein
VVIIRQYVFGNGRMRGMMPGQLFPTHQMGDDQPGAYLSDPGHFPDGQIRTFEMGKSGKADDMVKDIVLERNAMDIGLKHNIFGRLEFLSGLAGHLKGNIESADPALPSHNITKIGNQNSRSRSDVQDSSTGSHVERGDQGLKPPSGRRRIAVLFPLRCPNVKKIRILSHG